MSKVFPFVKQHTKLILSNLPSSYFPNMRLKILPFLFLLLGSTVQAPHQCSHAKSHEAHSAERLNFSQLLYNQMLQYDVKEYQIDLAVERNSIFIGGNVKIIAQVSAPSLSVFAFELHPNFTISNVEINGASYSVSSSGRERRVTLPGPLAAGAALEATIFYSGNGPVNPSNDDSGFWNNNNYTFTLCQPYGSAEWMPVKQILEDKADNGVKVKITTDAANRVGTQGLLKNTVELPGGKVRYEYESKYPVAYYLISIAVGQFVQHNIEANPTGTAQPILIENLARSSAELSSNLANINETAYQLELFSDLFGPYPFADEKYGQARLPAPFSLENQMMSAMGTWGIATVAHELAHQWIGNSVALKSFSHIWLNEGFATYSEFLYREFKNSRSVANTTLSGWMGSVKSQPGGRVYVADSLNTSDIFNLRLSYYKGALIYHMLRYMVNDDATFWAAIKSYTTAFAGKNVNTQDLAQSLQNSTGINFNSFMQQWVYGQGFPTYQIRWAWQEGQLSIEVNQSTSHTSTPFFDIPIELLVNNAQGQSKTIRLFPTQNQQIFTLEEAVEVSSLGFDPGLWLLANHSISKVAAPPTGTPTSLQDLQNLKLELFPNPTDAQVSLRWQEGSSSSARLSFTLFNALGQPIEVFRPVAGQESLTFSLEGQPKGVYILQLSDGQARRMFKIVRR